MRRTIRTAAIALGAAAATGLGLATAGAQPPDTETPAQEPTAQELTSYQLTSSTMTVPVNPFNYPTSTALCGDGDHVAGDWQPSFATGGLMFVPAVHANGDSDIYISYKNMINQNGTDSNNRPLWQGLRVQLGNHSWTQAKQGSFTWTCESH